MVKHLKLKTFIGETDLDIELEIVYLKDMKKDFCFEVYEYWKNITNVLYFCKDKEGKYYCIILYEDNSLYLREIEHQYFTNVVFQMDIKIIEFIKEA